MNLFGKLGFSWNRDIVPAYARKSMARAIFRYRRSLVQFVFDAGALEGNPFTFPEVKTLLDGVTVGGKRLSDQRQLLNLAEASEELFELVQSGQFRMDRKTFDRLHGLIADGEALESGHFRGEGEIKDATFPVLLGNQGAHMPSPTEAGALELNRVFAEGVEALESCVPDPLERGIAFFLFGALQQFYFDGNKRASRFMMNGILMSHGIDAISVPATRAVEFNEGMVGFFLDRNGTGMMEFLLDCRADEDLNPR